MWEISSNKVKQRDFYAQDIDQRRLKIGETGLPGFTWKIAIAAAVVYKHQQQQQWHMGSVVLSCHSDNQENWLIFNITAVLAAELIIIALLEQQQQRGGNINSINVSKWWQWYLTHLHHHPHPSSPHQHVLVPRPSFASCTHHPDPRRLKASCRRCMILSAAHPKSNDTQIWTVSRFYW